MKRTVTSIFIFTILTSMSFAQDVGTRRTTEHTQMHYRMQGESNIHSMMPAIRDFYMCGTSPTDDFREIRRFQEKNGTGC